MFKRLSVGAKLARPELAAALAFSALRRECAHLGQESLASAITSARLSGDTLVVGMQSSVAAHALRPWSASLLQAVHVALENTAVLMPKRIIIRGNAAERQAPIE